MTVQGLSFISSAPSAESTLPPLQPGCRIVVTIPAKDEEAYILPCLRALLAQRQLDGAPLDRCLYAVLVLANNCTDQTALLARRLARDEPGFQLFVVERDFPRSEARVGLARKIMMDAAALALPEEGIIATTDADTRVDEYWIAATLRAFDRGARAVGGRIVVPPSPRSGYRRTHLQDVTYRSLVSLLESMVDPDPDDPWPRHFQHYGPSLAVSRAAYLACGGMPPLAAIEDAAFGWALERIDVSFVHDPSVKVFTSDRDSERIAGVAFSSSLREWTRMATEAREPAVIGLAHALQLIKWKVALRRAYRDRRVTGLPALESLTQHLGISLDALQRTIGLAPSFGSLYLDLRNRIVNQPGFSDRTYGEAIAELRRFTRGGRGGRSSSKRPAGNDRSGARVRGTRLSAAG